MINRRLLGKKYGVDPKIFDCLSYKYKLNDEDFMEFKENNNKSIFIFLPKIKIDLKFFSHKK